MTRNPTAADTWVEHHANSGLPKVILKRIRANGENGTGHGPERKRMTDDTATRILWLIQVSGVAGTPGRTYLVDVLRWHFGYVIAAIAPKGLTAPERAFVNRRAYDLVTEHAARMPHIVRDKLHT